MTAWPFHDSADYGTTDDDTPADLQQYRQRASFSRDESQPLEKLASEACGTTHLYRLEDGRLLARRVDCRTKACPKCGPRLREEYAAGYAAVLASKDHVGPHGLSRLVVDAGWRKRPGSEYLRIPAPGGRLVVYTTADQGERVKTLTLALAADFAAMPSDRRHVSASATWRHAYQAWREEQQPTTKTPPEHLGQLRRSLEQVAIIAAELDMLVDQQGDWLILRDPPDQATWQRFCALTGLCRRGGGEVRAA